KTTFHVFIIHTTHTHTHLFCLFSFCVFHQCSLCLRKYIYIYVLCVSALFKATLVDGVTTFVPVNYNSISTEIDKQTKFTYCFATQKYKSQVKEMEQKIAQLEETVQEQKKNFRKQVRQMKDELQHQNDQVCLLCACIQKNIFKKNKKKKKKNTHTHTHNTVYANRLEMEQKRCKRLEEQIELMISNQVESSEKKLPTLRTQLDDAVVKLSALRTNVQGIEMYDLVIQKLIESFLHAQNLVFK
ncbi:hypothetical protein RFI_16858, partial [Reticulomyxa filosa]